MKKTIRTGGRHQTKNHYLPTHRNTGSIDVSHKYTGQEHDDSTDLYFYNARYYDPAMGRFIQADKIVPNPANPQDLNRYSYVRNNPINLVDPSGHSSHETTATNSPHSRYTPPAGGFAGEDSDVGGNDGITGSPATDAAPRIDFVVYKGKAAISAIRVIYGPPRIAR